MRLDNTGKAYLEEEFDDDGNFSAGLREDGLWDIPLDLNKEDLLALALDAHNMDITLNDHLQQIIRDAVRRSENTQATS